MRHISPQHDLSSLTATRSTLTSCFHRGIEFAQRLDARGYPVTASQSPRQICITPFCQVVVGPIWVWFQCSLHQITAIVENEYDWIGTIAAHISDLIGGQ